MVCKVKKEYVFGGRRKEKGERRKEEGGSVGRQQKARKREFWVVCVECRKKKCILKKEGIASMNFSFLMIK